LLGYHLNICSPFSQQFVKTDKYPVKLYYVEHLDEVWVLCWNANHDSGRKTVVVVRDASKDIRHHIVHTQPIGYRFDLVSFIIYTAYMIQV